jgi:uncharacterized BrkB/YihY/UPF0761 family membrane protein
VAAGRRYREIRGATVAAALTLNAFSALFPALVCATAVVGFLARGHPDVARRVTDSLGLHGTAAQLVEDAVAGAAADAALFVWSARVFTTVVVPWRDRLPGAVAFAAGMSLLKPLATVALPRLIAASSGLYGSIGAVFATLAWLGLLARLVVFCAALNASLGEPGPGDG